VACSLGQHPWKFWIAQNTGNLAGRGARVKASRYKVILPVAESLAQL
jgi:hypothetical protein